MWPSWHGWKAVDALKREAGFPGIAERDPVLSRMVRDFYKVHFWDVLRLDQVRHQSIANELFDTAVNVGVRVAGRWLQTGLNALNRDQRSWPDIAVDGIVGRQTIERVNALNGTDASDLFDLLNIQQGTHYLNLTQQDRTQEVFLRGWLTRVNLMK
jgi:lysozyme family protein